MNTAKPVGHHTKGGSPVGIAKAKPQVKPSAKAADAVPTKGFGK